MKLPTLLKHTLSTQKAQQRLGSILSKTRQRTTGVMKVWKQIGQWAWERIPVLSPLKDLWDGEAFISQVAIPRWSLGWWGRVIIVFTEAIFILRLYRYGSDIVAEASHNLNQLIWHLKRPNHLSMKTVVLMITMSIGSIAYYGMIKSGDLKQAIKEHHEERH